MKINPLASDSMGTRSMATHVETEDLEMVIDPGVALGPKRYGLPPHPLEREKLDEDWRVIGEHALKSDLMVITHYHFDHYSLEKSELFLGKRALVKHPQKKINKSQKKRARDFLSRVEGVEYCDSRTYSRGGTTLKFSPPVYHGTSPRLGYVVELCVEDSRERFLYSSDVEGPSVGEQVDFILECNPHTAYIDGPMTYMLGFRYSPASLEASIKNLVEIVEETEIKTLILDHHLAREPEWRERLKEVEKACEDHDCEFTSAALYSGKEELMLEARRKKLYQEFPTENKK